VNSPKVLMLVVRVMSITQMMFVTNNRGEQKAVERKLKRESCREKAVERKL
jgi:hypothetical protein